MAEIRHTPNAAEKQMFPIPSLAAVTLALREQYGEAISPDDINPDALLPDDTITYAVKIDEELELQALRRGITRAQLDSYLFPDSYAILQTLRDEKHGHERRPVRTRSKRVIRALVAGSLVLGTAAPGALSALDASKKGVSGIDLVDTAAGWYVDAFASAINKVIGGGQPVASTANGANATTSPSIANSPSVTISPSATPTASPTPTKTATCEQQLAATPLQNQLAHLIMIPIKGDGSSYDGTLSAAQVRNLVQQKHIGGVIEVETKPTAALKQLAALDPTLIVAIDDEGGIVNRFQDGALPSQANMAKKTPAEITSIITARAKMLKSYGFNTNFAPVLDLTPANGKPSQIGQSRIFSGDPQIVAKDGELYAEAMKASGINPVFKHFGGGSMSGNTDNGPATAAVTARDYIPYKLVKKDARTGLMIGTFVPTDNSTGGKPAAFSKVSYEKAAGFGFTGPIFTDDIGTKASNLPLDKAFVAALESGATMPLFVHDLNGTKGASTTAEIDAMIQAAMQAIKAGELSKTQVNTAVTRNASFLGLTACQAAQSLR